MTNTRPLAQRMFAETTVSGITPAVVFWDAAGTGGMRITCKHNIPGAVKRAEILAELRRSVDDHVGPDGRLDADALSAEIVVADGVWLRGIELSPYAERDGSYFHREFAVWAATS